MTGDWQPITGDWEEDMPDDKKLLKTGLIVAALIIVLRIILEQTGAPETMSFIFGVAWLYFIMPVFFALAIRAHGSESPYRKLLKDVVLFAAYTRIMVAVTYMLAWHFKWTPARFSANQGGTVGENVPPFQGLLLVPLRNLLIWIVMATIVGMIVGAITLALKGKQKQNAAGAM